MRALTFLVIALWASCSGTAWVEGTFAWLGFNRRLPELTLPEECGTRMFVNESGSLIAVDLNVNITNATFPNIRRSRNAEFPWPWVVKVGGEAAGVLISQQHVITLAHCIQNYTRWFGGYYGFSVNVLKTDVEVARVQLQNPRTSLLPIAVLTLSHNLTWHSSPVCLGSYAEGFLAMTVGWDIAGDLVEQPLRIYRHSQCQDYFQEYYHGHFMVCGSPAPMTCGSPLLQTDNGRWMIVGLSTGELGTIASKYILIDSAREWLEEI